MIWYMRVNAVPGSTWSNDARGVQRTEGHTVSAAVDYGNDEFESGIRRWGKVPACGPDGAEWITCVGFLTMYTANPDEQPSG